MIDRIERNGAWRMSGAVQRANRVVRRPWLLLIAMTMACGCGGPTGPKLVTVSGKLTYSGAPVKDAIITLLPVDAKVGRPATAVTGADGRFSVRSGAAGQGLVPGAYKIRIEAYKVPIDEIPPEQLMAREEENRAIPKQYFDEQTSGLELTVTGAEASRELNFDLVD